MLVYRDIPGYNRSIGREVWRGMGQGHSDSYNLEALGFDVDEPNVLFPFRELIGALLWIALLTRPDIANAVRAVARYCSAPKLIHWKAARSILGYAVRTSYFGISFQKGALTGLSLISFADADYASRSTDRRSV